MYVGELLQEHLGSDLAIIQNNRPTESSDENPEQHDKKEHDQENRGVEVADSVQEFGSSIAEERQKLPTVATPSTQSAGDSFLRAAKALVPSVYQESEDCGSVQC